MSSLLAYIKEGGGRPWQKIVDYLEIYKNSSLNDSIPQIGAGWYPHMETKIIHFLQYLKP